MIDTSNYQHNPHLEKIVQVLCTKTQNMDKNFFRPVTAFFLSKMASCMKAYISTKDRGNIIINSYVIATAPSGYGKNFSISLLEDSFLNKFKKNFCDITLPTIANSHMEELANNMAQLNGTDPSTIFDQLWSIYVKCGVYPFTFDSGTTPAIKQLRTKLQLAGVGAINLAIDEIASNLLSSVDVLNAFLELYDRGEIKTKLTKNTSDNIRDEDYGGSTPANMLLFGTPSKLFDGSSVEDQFYSFLDIGYARRCLFGYGTGSQKKAYQTSTASQIYASLVNPQNEQIIQQYSTMFAKLADPLLVNFKIELKDAEAIKLLEYKLECERQADLLPEHKDIQKSELSHRYFKALKLAGTFAFLDRSPILKEEYLRQAIKLVEESGESFKKILTREKTYMKLAKYIASCGTEVTHADLNEALPYYKSSNSARNELMTLAIAWGYRQHIIIKKSFEEGIEFFKGETLQETDLNKMFISYSQDLAYGYTGEEQAWDNLYKLTQADGYSWCTHEFSSDDQGIGHRCDNNVLPRFNLVVVDVDDGITMQQAQKLLKDYKWLMYTTKRYTPDHNRFRIVFPLNYNLKLSKEDYKEFMNNILSWLPFKSDEGANQISRKWLSNQGTYLYNDGLLLDALPFIPKTTKNEEYLKVNSSISNLDNLQAWFARTMVEGNRNNMLLRYAYTLKDGGYDYSTVEKAVISFNKQLKSPLPLSELKTSIFTTLSKAYSEA